VWTATDADRLASNLLKSKAGKHRSDEEKSPPSIEYLQEMRCGQAWSGSVEKALQHIVGSIQLA